MLIAVGHLLSLIRMETTDLRNVHGHHQSITHLGVRMLQLLGCRLLAAAQQIGLAGLTGTVDVLVKDVLVESLLILDLLHSRQFLQGLTIIQSMF